MTHSADFRRNDAFALLKFLFSELRDQAIDETPFDPSEASLQQFQQTSWDELVAEGMLNQHSGNTYFFKPSGWSEALYRFGNMNDPQLAVALGALSKALKGARQGTGRDGPCGFYLDRRRDLPSTRSALQRD